MLWWNLLVGYLALVSALLWLLHRSKRLASAGAEQAMHSGEQVGLVERLGEDGVGAGLGSASEVGGRRNGLRLVFQRPEMAAAGDGDDASLGPSRPDRLDDRDTIHL